MTLTKCGLSHKGVCILRSVARIELSKRIIAVVTGACIFGGAAAFINKDCRVLFGDIFIVPFLGPALGYLTAIFSPGNFGKIWLHLIGSICRGQGI